MEIFHSTHELFFKNLIFVYAQILNLKKYLKFLGAKNIKYIGNLKFTQSEKERFFE